MNRKMIALATAVIFLLCAGLTCGCFAVYMKFRQDRQREIEMIKSDMETLDDAMVSRQMSLCRWYNYCLCAENPPFNFEDSYPGILDISDGMMGYLDLPSLGLNLPIVHGAQRDASDFVAGHIPGSALPIGGEGSHSIFTAPDEIAALKEGDWIAVHILNKTLVYRVEHIRTVSPGYTGGQAPQNGEDLCTLVILQAKGMESKKIMIHASRLSPEQECDALEAMAHKPVLDRDVLHKSVQAFVGVLIIPLVTGCIGFIGNWIIQQLVCRRLTKKIG